MVIKNKLEILAKGKGIILFEIILVVVIKNILALVVVSITEVQFINGENKSADLSAYKPTVALPYLLWRVEVRGTILP